MKIRTVERTEGRTELYVDVVRGARTEYSAWLTPIATPVVAH